MNIYNNIFTILFSFFSLTLFSQQTLIEIDQEEATLEQVIQILEADYDFHFSYKVDDIQKIIVLPPSEKTTLDVFLSAILKPTELDFEIVQNNYIILKKKNDGGNSSELDARNNRNLQLLCGSVIDGFSKEPLLLANVYLKDSQVGTTSELDGSFSFYAEIKKRDTLIISYVGYPTIQVSATNLIGKPCREFVFENYLFPDDLIVVTAYLTDGVSTQDNGSYTKLKPNVIKALPGQAEPDVLKTIQFLPGISSPDGSASSISIRGGTPDQNLILWEEIPVYHTAHYFGNLSAFNPYIIDQAKIFRGGFNSEYGGRISGVIDLKTEDLSNGKSEYDVGINFINAFANGKVSFLENKVSLVFSVRRSISEIWRSPTFKNFSQRVHRGILFQTPTNQDLPEEIEIDDKFYFFDSNVKASFQISEKDKISIAGFFGQNDFQSELKNDMREQVQSDSLFLENSGLSFAWDRNWNNKFSSKLTTLISDYHYDYDYSLVGINPSPQDKFGLKRSMINEKQIHFSNQYKTSKEHKIKFGYQFINYDVGFQVTKQTRDNPQANQIKEYQSNVHVGYASFNTNKEKKLGFDFGLRGSFLESENQTYLEPRLKTWYKFTDHFGFNFNAGKYYQFLSQLEQIEGDRASIETPVWVLGGEKEVPILDATQYQLGFVFHKNDWLIDVQTYYKNINGLTSLATGFDEELTGEFHLGSAKINGLDILVKKRWGNYSSWMSYSLSKVKHEFSTFFDADFNASNDQPHNFNWVHMWSNNKVEFSVGWKFASGTPYSLKENYMIQIEQGMMGPRESILPIVKEYNGERLPARHQLDASILYKFYINKTRKNRGKIGLSFFNIYNQTNIYKRGFFMDIRPNVPPKLDYTDQLELGFTPNFVLRFEL
ncbi:MAG: carboxypeptidase-like regulatory domain-containing protein [Saprospiraceae bacterium]